MKLSLDFLWNTVIYIKQAVALLKIFDGLKSLKQNTQFLDIAMFFTRKKE